MMTWVWGPFMWTYMHMISVTYPIRPTLADQRRYQAWVESIQHVLPCRSCRENVPSNLQACPLTPSALASRKSFARWMFDFHNTVNDMLGKPKPCSFEEIWEKYTGMYTTARIKQLYVQFTPKPYGNEPSPHIAHVREVGVPSVSNVCIQSHLWRPIVWFVASCISFNFKTQDAIHYLVFLHHMGATLPCTHERDAWIKAFHSDRLFHTRAEFAKHVYHGFRELWGRTDSFASTQAYFEKFRAQCGPSQGQKEKGCTKMERSMRCASLIWIR